MTRAVLLAAPLLSGCTVLHATSVDVLGGLVLLGIWAFVADRKGARS